MARYIDTQKVTVPSGFFNKDLGVPDLLKWLEAQPTADVVPVVRCKNCKHLTEDGFCFKNINGLGGYKKPKADDFCSYGERKE